MVVFGVRMRTTHIHSALVHRMRTFILRWYILRLHETMWNVNVFKDNTESLDLNTVCYLPTTINVNSNPCLTDFL